MLWTKITSPSTGAIRIFGAMLMCLGAMGLIPVLSYASDLWRGPAWPKENSGATIITYYVVPGTPSFYQEPIERGAFAWNTSGLNLRLVRTNLAHEADITISEDKGMTGGTGWANVGYKENSIIVLNRCLQICYGKHDMASTVAHEFGHSLGIQHPHEDNICSLMTSHFFMACANEPASYNANFWRCRSIERPELNILQSIYGGSSSLSGPRYCKNRAPQIKNVSFQLSKHGSFSLKAANKDKSSHYVHVKIRRGTCPIAFWDKYATELFFKPLRKDSRISVWKKQVSELQSGTYCVKVWPVDKYYRHGTSRSFRFSI